MKNNIAEYRELREMTQDELGKLIGVTGTTISRYESGENAISSTKLLQISKILCVGIDTLLNNASNIVDLNKIDENQKEAIELIMSLPKAKVDKVVGFCQALKENE